MEDQNKNCVVGVKRKRGRPAKEGCSKKQHKEEEDVCFICFDGGNLVLCDHRTCPKAYHPECINRDESFFRVKARWTCGWHICSVCLKAAHYMCYTCTYSLCKGCTRNADYVHVRGDKGFCATCMTTIIKIEKEEEGEGDKEMVMFPAIARAKSFLVKMFIDYGDITADVDFDDEDSWEYIFKGYWFDLKEKLSLSSEELSRARNLQKESGSMICKGQVPGFHVGVPHTNLNNYAAIDMHNINLIYLRRNSMENLIGDEKFHDKVVGSVVRIRIPVDGQKEDMYRLVKVVGTIKVSLPYKVGVKTTDVMLEVFDLDKKEIVSIDTISNQDFSEDECRSLRQSIKCGHVKGFIVGEIQEKALALRSVRLKDCLIAETRRLNHLYDQQSENGRKRYLRKCVEKVQLLKTKQKHQRRLCEIPDVHFDPKMDPGYESEEAAEQLDSPKQDECIKAIYSGKREGKPISSSVYSSETKLWHYIDINGKNQGPLCMLQLQKYSTTGYFPPDLRIWAGDSQENSILLTDALKGMFYEVSSLPNDELSQSPETGVTSDSELHMSDLGFNSASASRCSKQTEAHWQGDTERIHSYNKGETLSSDGCKYQNFIWTAPGVSTPIVICSQVNSFNSNSRFPKQHEVQSPWSSTIFVGRENVTHSGDDLNQVVKGCKSGPDYKNKSSGGTRVGKSSPRQILGDHSNSHNTSGGLHLADISEDCFLSSVKPDALCDHAATANFTSDELAPYFKNHSASGQSNRQIPSEPIVLRTLPEEAVEDLWAEIDVMESQSVIAPTITSSGT